MKKVLPLVLLFCLMLSGCGSEKLIHTSSGWTDLPLSIEGDAYGFGPLEKGEVYNLRLENRGSEPAWLDLLLTADEGSEEKLYKSIRLGGGEKRMLPLKPRYDSNGKGLAYTVKLVRGSDAKIFFSSDAYKLESEYNKPISEADFIESEEDLAEKAEIYPLSEESSEKTVSFELEDKVQHFFIEYEGEKESKTELSLYRSRDNLLIMSGKAEPKLRLNSENTFTPNGEREAFYISLKNLEAKPLEGRLVVHFFYEAK